MVINLGPKGSVHPLGGALVDVPSCEGYSSNMQRLNEESKEIVLIDRLL